MKSAICALMSVLLLASCTAARFDEKTRAVTAPDVVQYSKPKQEAAAKEVESGSCPALTEFAQDYCVMRDQSRVLLGLSPVCTSYKEPRTWKSTTGFSPLKDVKSSYSSAKPK